MRYLKIGKTLVKPCQYYFNMTLNEKEYIALCKEQIEKKLNLGTDLIERDYEYLHEVILKQTKTDLSTSTLRRIWSDKYHSVPQTKTLDALAQLLGHAGWHDFKQNQQGIKRKSFQLNAQLIAYAFGLVLVICSIILLTSTGEVIGKATLYPEVHVHEGVPATIGIHYDIRSPNIDIELSWNPYERTRLDMNLDFYTGTYFYPDYHQAKLLHGEQVLASVPIHVTTPGWHGLIMHSGYDPNPDYMDSAEYMHDDKLKVVSKSLDGADKLALPVFTLSHADLSYLSGDDFGMTAKVRSESYSEAQSCGLYEILIKGSTGNIRIPISQNGCYGLTTLKCAGKILSGKQNDLSALSTELSEEHQIRIELKRKEMHIKLGSNPTYEVEYENDIGPLKVIKFIFQGPSELCAFELLDSDGNKLQSPALSPF